MARKSFLRLRFPDGRHRKSTRKIRNPTPNPATIDHQHEWRKKTPPAKAGLVACSWSSLGSVEWVEWPSTCCWLMVFCVYDYEVYYAASIPKKDAFGKRQLIWNMTFIAYLSIYLSILSFQRPHGCKIEY